MHTYIATCQQLHHCTREGQDAAGMVVVTLLVAALAFLLTVWLLKDR